MITTDIQTPDSPHTREILETAKALGIVHYRWRDFVYKPDLPSPADRRTEAWNLGTGQA